jgi:filamentous hemagglutinin family protein
MQYTVEAFVKLHDSEKSMILGPLERQSKALPSRADGGLPKRAGEKARSQKGLKGRFSASKSFAIASLVFFTLPICLFALNGPPEVVKGSADYSLTESTEVVRVSDKTILEYKNFNIEHHEATRYEQPSSKSTLLCRVKGNSLTNVRGTLEANGKLLLINPNGIIFSDTSQVNVGTLIASTLNIADDDFLNDRFKFQLTPGTEDSYIMCAGTINAAHNVIFMSPHIAHHGVITAKAGTIAMVGGEVITLDFDGDQMIQFAVDSPLKGGYIENAGVLAAGKVFLELPMAQKVIKNVLNDTGVIEAGHIAIEQGVIYLKAGSSIKANDLHMRGDTFKIAGELKIAGLCEMNATQEIHWLAGNTVGHLKTETEQFNLAAPLKADKWTSKATVKYVLESSIDIHNNPLIFDAPVSINAAEVSLSTGDSGRSIVFLDRVDAEKSAVKLNLTAGLGDIDFKNEVSVGHLNVLSAHNVNTNLVNVDQWTLENVKGIATVGGDVHSTGQVSLKAYALKVDHSVTVDKGSLHMETEGNLKTSEGVVLSAGDITHTGLGDVLLGGKWLAKDGGITVDGNVQLVSNVTFEAPKGDVHFNKGIGGLGWLDVKAQNFTTLGDIGPISYLNVDTEKSIKLSNVGRGDKGIVGVLRLHAKGPIYFEGTEYVAEGHDFKSNASFEFNSGEKTTVFARSVVPTVFEGGPINLSENTTLEIRSNQGPVQLTPVVGQLGSNLTVHAPTSQLMASTIKNVDHLELSADEMILQGIIDSGSIHLKAKQPIQVEHLMTAQTGDFIVQAPLHLTRPKTLLQALQGKMEFDGALSGNTELSLRAPEGEIVLKGKLGDKKQRFKTITLYGKKIAQHEPVISTGPVNYNAEQILLGHDITSENAITLDGPVTLFNNSAIQLTTSNYRAPILLTSTLDADEPSRTLFINNKKSPTQFQGAIGKKGALGELVIHSGQVIFHDDIGGEAPGITGKLQITSKGSATECKGATYYAGQQIWDTKTIHLKHEGPVEFKTAGLPLEFGKDASLALDRTTSFTVDTQGGALDLAKITSDFDQPITIRTGRGDSKLHSIGEEIQGLPNHVSDFHIESRNISIRGFIRADKIFMEADANIEYDYGQSTLHSKGEIILNAKNGRIGGPGDEQSISLITPEKLFVGAKTAAYLKGTCQGQYPYGYPGNSPPRTFLNGIELNLQLAEDTTEDEVFLKTLTPALSHSVPTGLMDGGVIKPRKAPIYYDTSSK